MITSSVSHRERFLSTFFARTPPCPGRARLFEDIGHVDHVRDIRTTATRSFFHVIRAVVSSSKLTSKWVLDSRSSRGPSR